MITAFPQVCGVTLAVSVPMPRLRAFTRCRTATGDRFLPSTPRAGIGHRHDEGRPLSSLNNALIAQRPAARLSGDRTATRKSACVVMLMGRSPLTVERQGFTMLNVRRIGTPR